MLIVVRRCIITGSGKGEKEYTILPKAKKGQVIPIRQIVMNVPHIIWVVRDMTGIVLATIFQQQKRAKEREEEQKKGIIRTHYIIKTEKVLTMFFVLAVFLFGGATVASAIQQDDLLPPIG